MKTVVSVYLIGMLSTDCSGETRLACVYLPHLELESVNVIVVIITITSFVIVYIIVLMHEASMSPGRLQRCRAPVYPCAMMLLPSGLKQPVK